MFDEPLKSLGNPARALACQTPTPNLRRQQRASWSQTHEMRSGPWIRWSSRSSKDAPQRQSMLDGTQSVPVLQRYMKRHKRARFVNECLVPPTRDAEKGLQFDSHEIRQALWILQVMTGPREVLNAVASCPPSLSSRVFPLWPQAKLRELHVCLAEPRPRMTKVLTRAQCFVPQGQNLDGK